MLEAGVPRYPFVKKFWRPCLLTIRAPTISRGPGTRVTYRQDLSSCCIYTTRSIKFSFFLVNFHPLRPRSLSTLPVLLFYRRGVLRGRTYSFPLFRLPGVVRDPVFWADLFYLVNTPPFLVFFVLILVLDFPECSVQVLKETISTIMT